MAADWHRGAIGLLLRVVKSIDEFGDVEIFCPPQMHGGKHCDNAGTLEPTTVIQEQVKEIPLGEAGVEGVIVAETPDPSVFYDLVDYGDQVAGCRFLQPVLVSWRSM